MLILYTVADVVFRATVYNILKRAQLVHICFIGEYADAAKDEICPTLSSLEDLIFDITFLHFDFSLHVLAKISHLHIESCPCYPEKLKSNR